MRNIKAKIHHRVNVENHSVLGEVVPLDAPYVLLIDPSNLCNLSCNFCPTGNHILIQETGRFQGILSFDLFKKIIDDLKDFAEPIRVLRLYKEGEPLINKFFPDMIKYARDSKRIKRIDTTTNGLLLNPTLNRRIVESGLNQINISVNGINSDHYYKYTKTKIDFNEYVSNIKDLYVNRGECEVCVKAIKETLSVQEQEQFFDIFGNISDRIYLENLSPAWPQFVFENIDMKFSSGNYGQEIIERKVCPYIFYIMVVNSDGRCSLCVGDWKHCLIYGDLKVNSAKEVWNNSLINKHRLLQLEGRRCEVDFCANCEVVSHGTLDNLDEYAEQIIERMKK